MNKDESNKLKLKDYIRKNIEDYWNGIRRNIDSSLINIDIQEEFDMILHDKKIVDSLLQQNDRRVTNLYHERIRFDRYERIHYDGKHDQVKDARYKEIVDEYEKYRKFAKDMLTNQDNKSNALMVPLLELVYPLKLRKLHENQERKHRTKLVNLAT